MSYFGVQLQIIYKYIQAPRLVAIRLTSVHKKLTTFLLLIQLYKFSVKMANCIFLGVLDHFDGNKKVINNFINTWYHCIFNEVPA